jgi:hypothetical protein
MGARSAATTPCLATTHHHKVRAVRRGGGGGEAAPVRGREAAADLRAEGDYGRGRGRRCGRGGEVARGGAMGGNGVGWWVHVVAWREWRCGHSCEEGNIK